MITKFQKFNLIKESPDTLRFKDGSDPASWSDDDAVPFFVTVSPGHDEVKDIFIGGFGDFHSSIGYNGYRREKAYPGRLWLDRKVISFWVYPNEGLFKDIIQNLEKELNTKIFNNGWRIEVLELEGGKLLKQEFDPNFEPEDYFFGADEPLGNYILIPIEKYIGSEDVPEEIQIQHLMKWQEKELAKKVGKIHFGKWGSYKTGWDQPHNIKWRQAIYQESKNTLIKETPDKIINSEYELGWWNNDTRPFMMTVNKKHTEVKEIFLAPSGWAHLDMSYPDDVAYAGRLWLNSKIMSFWVYPNVELFKSFIKKLEEILSIKIFNNGWKIEIIESDEGEIKRREVKKSNFDYFFGTRDIRYTRNYKIIPIEEYVGSENVPEEEKIKHLMSWQEKELARKLGKLHFSDHFGSALTAWDSPHNIKWRQSIYQENKNN